MHYLKCYRYPALLRILDHLCDYMSNMTISFPMLAGGGVELIEHDRTCSREGCGYCCAPVDRPGKTIKTTFVTSRHLQFSYLSKATYYETFRSVEYSLLSKLLCSNACRLLFSKLILSGFLKGIIHILHFVLLIFIQTDNFKY